MKDENIFNVIVVNEKDDLGEVFIIAEDIEDCLNTVKKINSQYQIQSLTSLAIYKNKVAELELIKKDLVFAVRSDKMLHVK